jgi:hypothetical protein
VVFPEYYIFIKLLRYRISGMVHGEKGPKIRVPRRVYELLGDAQLREYLDMTRENHERGFVMLQSHLLRESKKCLLCIWDRLRFREVPC